MPDIPMSPKFTMWPQQTGPLPHAEIVRMYEQGFAGAYPDPAAHERLMDDVRSQGGYAVGEEAAHAFGIADSGAGKLSINFPGVLQLFPGCLPGPAQECGDCVSHSSKNAALVTVCHDILSGEPDEQSGNLEGKPDVSDEGIRNGVLSSEGIYWYRGSNGDGWSCPVAAHVMMKNGIWLRRNYTEAGVDLSKYSGHNAHAYGGREPPEAFTKIGQAHTIRTVTDLTTREAIRDFIHNGYGLTTCGGEGFASVRDANGVSKRQGSWSHALSYWGWDERQCIIDLYREPLVLIQNSWAAFNSGPRLILGTNIMIPEGSFWARYSDVRNREVIALSCANGWPPRLIKDYGSGILG